MDETRILVADDSPDYLELLTLLVEEMPRLAVVGRAADGPEAVQLATELHPDIALLDINMPGLDGFDAAEEIRRVSPETTVFLHTATLDDDLSRRAAERDLFAFEKLDLVKTIGVLARLDSRAA